MKDRKIYFVCDAGMGSSALGASLLKRRLKAHGLKIEVMNYSISDLEDGMELIVSHASFKSRILHRCPNANVFQIDDFMNDEMYERIVDWYMAAINSSEILKIENIQLNQETDSSDNAIRSVGALLVNAGYASAPYIEGMLERDHSLTTYIGNEIAIPHGEYEAKQYVHKTGIAVQIYPQGIDWHGNRVRIVIGIAALNDDHMSILSNIAIKLSEMEEVERVVASSNKQYIYDLLTKEEQL